MANFNRVIIAGNLTRDPEYKQFTTGQNLCKLGLASNRQFKNRQTGTMVQEVCFVDIDVWGPQADVCRQYLQKGRAVLVEGRLKLDSWKDNDGQSRSKLFIVADRVVFLSSNVQDISNQDFSQDKHDFSSEKIEPKNQLEKDILDQIDELKEKKSTKKVGVNKKSNGASANDNFGGEIDFKDEPPFQDDLPF